ncbi:unnamed protein product [Paramecium primaurelia]|uniref:Uncharacterized protein n=1 Tax=Paramecium primaurelia TaxID=5886 RepID=A0A8S1KBV5_PARPR|nr:unnamed protein product [Paramecium primaurelia]
MKMKQRQINIIIIQDEISEKIEYFLIKKKQNNQQYQIMPIISKLHNQTKNQLLSVDQSDMDKIIYQNILDEFAPNIQSDYIFIKKIYLKNYIQNIY